MEITTWQLHLRIHGDNIVECERALELLASSLGGKKIFTASRPFMPVYLIHLNDGVIIKVELLSGHGHWGLNLPEILIGNGAPLREGSDAVITEVSSDGKLEKIIVIMEYCSALPAGNQAWQRSGRALTTVMAGIPYLYITEFGGVELDEHRNIKSPRFPNPIIPFSYISASRVFNQICLPVYLPSPAISQSLRGYFSPTFGQEELKEIIRGLLAGSDTRKPYEALEIKALISTQLLADMRQRGTSLSRKEWSELLAINTGQERAEWLALQNRQWSKKWADKVVVTASFNEFSRRILNERISVSIGADDIPISLIPTDKRKMFAGILASIYGGILGEEQKSWLENSSKPLVLVWITGFKPKGDDARPDRGLVPLVRMLFGLDVDVLSIISGPAKKSLWDILRRNPDSASRQNGLIEAVYNLSEAILVDSATSIEPFFILHSIKQPSNKESVDFSSAKYPTEYSEQDVDTAIHTLFTYSNDPNIFEALCNPPGGDWSGISVLNFVLKEELRWTSLPRVSDVEGKRPDHVIEFNFENCVYLLVIESKDTANRLEAEIGPRMQRYIERLLPIPPIAHRNDGENWNLIDIDNPPTVPQVQYITCGSFCWKNLQEMRQAVQRGMIDLALAWEFHGQGTLQPTILHIVIGPTFTAGFLLNILMELIKGFRGKLVIKIH